MPLKAMSLLAAVIVFGSWSLAHADVPNAADIATCNHEAQEAWSKGEASRTASPNTKDHSRAADARRDTAPPETAGSSDPQLAGMDAEGAKDPLYQAAYRTCMRKAGF
jgi:hypothetical protein